MLLSCGDALIDFLPVRTVDGQEALLPMVGGSCLNIAIGMARLGIPTGFVGGLSTDPFGCMIEDHVRESGVDLRLAARSARPTTLAFVRTVNGEARYAFYDEQTASRHWIYRHGSIRFAEIDAVHVGSTTLIDRSGAAQALELVEEARHTSTISFDPNCRPNLVQDKADYVARMDLFARRSHIVRMSDGDFAFLYGNSDFGAKAAALSSIGLPLFIITRGAGGVLAWHKRAGLVSVKAPSTKVVDTIGAGDSFQAALLVALHAMKLIARPSLEAMDASQLGRVLEFAVTCAAVTCSRAGANPPWSFELPKEASLV
jgi:fructokinase